MQQGGTGLLGESVHCLAHLTREKTEQMIREWAKVRATFPPADIASVFFDAWRQTHPKADLEDVPADLVMASASGLEPRITLANAMYQLDRVSMTWVAKTGGDSARTRQQILEILNERASAAFGGLFGVPLVNVLEVNLALRKKFAEKNATPPA